MPTFRCTFLGCKVNQYDAERARRYLLDRGFVETSDASPPPELFLVAACTVTARAATKSRRVLRDELALAPAARVALLGCLTDDDRRFYQSIGASVTRDARARVTLLPSATDDGFLAALAPVADELLRSDAHVATAAPTRRRARAFLKVEDGCDLSCSFCIIPSVRGRARSLPLERILAEARREIEAGARELVLTGVHLGHYGRENGRRTSTSLVELVRALARLNGDFRIRLSSLEVSELSNQLLELLEHEPRVVPHLHLPLQSGSETVLRRMRRPYTARLFREQVELVRARLDDPGLTTDVIVGFPGERDDDFAQTLELVRDAGFAKVHLFPFSARAGTEAATFGGRLPERVVDERRDALLTLERELSTRALARRVGRPAEVIVETIDSDGARVGHDERYHRVRIESCTSSRGELVRVEPYAARDGGLHARLAEARTEVGVE